MRVKCGGEVDGVSWVFWEGYFIFRGEIFVVVVEFWFFSWSEFVIIRMRKIIVLFKWGSLVDEISCSLVILGFIIVIENGLGNVF